MFELSALLIVFSVFVIALLYSSVGHGGASGYLAVMALLAVSPAVTRPTALILNLFVSSIAFAQFYRAGHFEWKIFVPFAASSVPSAFLGGMIQVSEPIYKTILGVVLMLAAIRLAIDLKLTREPQAPDVRLSLLIGTGLGFVSGLIGVGGGIFLTPILLLMNWTETKKAAGVSALFIFVNSASGLLGNWLLGKETQIANLPSSVWFWIGAAIVGGVIGSNLGSYRFNSLILRRVLAAGLLLAGGKLIFT
jgi:hypothetical protein